MMSMPEKDPNIWAGIWQAISASAAIKGAIMASIIAVLRVLYDGKETHWTRVVLESLICGLLALSASQLVHWFGVPDQVSVAAGGAIGFLGVTTIRECLVKWVGKRADS